MYFEASGWHFKQTKSISKGKLIGGIDSRCISDYANIIDALESNPSYSPHDESKNEFTSISLENFQKMVEQARQTNKRICEIKFISEVTGEKRNYAVSSVLLDNNLFILKKQHEIYDDVFVEDSGIFPTKAEVERNSGSSIDSVLK